MTAKSTKGKRRGQRRSVSATGRDLNAIELNAAGIDIGAASHFVAVPPGRDGESVREFSSFTSGLHAVAA